MDRNTQVLVASNTLVRTLIDAFLMIYFGSLLEKGKYILGSQFVKFMRLDSNSRYNYLKN